MAITVKQVEHAIKKTAGNVSMIARELGVTRKTVYSKIKASPTLTQLLKDTREELVDIAESALRRAVLEGNMTAIIFTLKTQGKGRGYVERQEITGKDGSELIKGYIGVSPDDWDDDKTDDNRTV